MLFTSPVGTVITCGPKYCCCKVESPENSGAMLLTESLDFFWKWSRKKGSTTRFTRFDNKTLQLESETSASTEHERDEDMQDTNSDSPKTTHDSPSSTPETPALVYRDMHLVAMTHVADDERSEAAAARYPVNTEPASVEVLVLEQMCNLLQSIFSQTSQPRELVQPHGFQASSPVDTSFEQPGCTDASDSTIPMVARQLPSALASPAAPRAPSTRPSTTTRHLPSALASPATAPSPATRFSHDAYLAEVRLRHVGARRQRVYKIESQY